MMRQSRLRKFRLLMERHHLAACLVSHPANISYLTEYASRDSFLLVTRSRAVYFTDSRYTLEARQALARNIEIRLIGADFPKLVRNTANELCLDTVGFEGRYVSYAFYQRLTESCGRQIGLLPVPELAEELRQIKEPGEVARIREAAGITGKAYSRIRRYLEPGLTELEVVGELERIIRREGASGASFDIIVAGGPNSCFPHHLSGPRKLRRGEPVIIDMGVVVGGYRSDLTRTFFLGKINSLFQRVYDTVRRAQEESFRLIKPGVTAGSLDAAARAYIAQQGYGKYFGHNLGHGVGIEVHESPSISGKSAAIIKPGMLFTIEPGIYLPRKFGIRIEDMVLVTPKGREVISGSIHK